MRTNVPGTTYAEQAMKASYNKYTYDQLDCQAFVEQVLKDLDVRKPDGTVYNWRGSNSMYRNYVAWRGTKDEAIEKFGGIPLGAFMFKVVHDGGEEEKGYHDGLGNAQHVGIFCGGQLVRDSTRYKNSSGAYVRNGVGDAALKSFNMVVLPTMIDFNGEHQYNDDVEQMVSWISDIRKLLDKLEGKIYDVFGNHDADGQGI